MRSTLYLIIALTIFSNAYAQDSVNVKIVRENPKDMTKLILGIHLATITRQENGLSFGLGLDYDLVNRISLEGLAQFSPRYLSKTSRFEYQIGGNYYFLESRLKKREAKVYTTNKHNKTTYTLIKLNAVERFGVRVGTNQFFADYGSSGYYASTSISGSNAYLIEEKTSSLYLGTIFEIRQAATVDIEGYGRRFYERKLQIYADILLRAGGDSEYTDQPQTPLRNGNWGARVGFKWFKSHDPKVNALGIKAEVGTFPDLIIPSSDRLIPQLYLMVGAQYQIGFR